MDKRITVRGATLHEQFSERQQFKPLLMPKTGDLPALRFLYMPDVAHTSVSRLFLWRIQRVYPLAVPNGCLSQCAIGCSCTREHLSNSSLHHPAGFNNKEGRIVRGLLPDSCSSAWRLYGGKYLSTLTQLQITVLGSFYHFFINNEEVSMTVFFFLVGTVLSYVLPLILHMHELKFCRFLFGSLTMMFLTPTFINVFVIYAISNLHDISWGNRPS